MAKRFVVVFCIFSMAFQYGTALAEETPGLTPDALVTRALRMNAGFKAKKAAYEAAKSKVIEAWLPEDPMFGVDVEGQPDLFEFDKRMNLEYMAQQEIPFPTKLILRGLVAAKEADIRYQEYKEAERDLVWHLEQPYYELYRAQKTVETLEENQKILDQLVQSAKARYESGQASQNDLLKAQIEHSKNSIEIFDWREKAHVAQAHFAHLLNEPLNTRYTIAPPGTVSGFSYSHEQLEAIALQKRPELLAFERGVEKAKLSGALTNTAWLPDLTIRWEGRDFREEGRDFEHDTFIGVSVPVWSVLKGVGGVWQSSGLEVRAAEEMYVQMKNQTFLKVHEAYSKFKASDNALQIFENSILPQARQQVEVELASYEAGRSDFLSVVDAQRTLREVQIDYAQHRAEREMALSDLRFAVGDDLKGSKTNA